MGYDMAKIGILLSVFLFIDGAAAWLLGLEFADPVRHMTLAPYAPIGLYGGPVLLIAACLLSFLSYYMLAKREPELPKIITPVPPTQPEKAPGKVPEEAPEWPPKEAQKGEAPRAAPEPEKEKQSILGKLRRNGKKGESAPKEGN
jgi:hypothetical protein